MLVCRRVNEIKKNIYLPDVRIAAFVADGFEEAPFAELRSALQTCGASVEVLAQTSEQMQKGIQGLQPQALIQDALPDTYQALLIPAGVLSADGMRASRLHIGFVQSILAEGKQVAVIGHGAWLLGDSGLILGRILTSSPTIRKDLERAGAIWRDQEIVFDGNILSAQAQADPRRFSRIFLEELAIRYGRGIAAA